MEVGFIGYGEASYELSLGLKQEDFHHMTAYDPMWNHPTYGELVQERAQKAGVKLAAEPKHVLERVDLVIAAVPADKALEVSQSLKNSLKPGCVYADVSACSPAMKRGISTVVEEAGALFVDAAMMGPLPVYKHKVPILASGNGTDAFINQLSSLGMDITKVSENPGEATAVKLIRSIFMKGIGALLIEMLEAAHAFHVEERVIHSISETMDGRTFEETMNRLVTGTSIHALRRGIELEGSIEMLDSAKIDSTLSRAAREKLQHLSTMNLKEKFQGKTPAHWLDAIKAMQMNG